MGAPGTTPGPWAVSKQKPRRVTAGGVVICNAFLRNQLGGNNRKAARNGKDEAEAEANAHQIAASGALYDALEAILAKDDIADDGGFLSTKHANLARAALSLARGESPHV